jgi:hypothetical protein
MSNIASSHNSLVLVPAHLSQVNQISAYLEVSALFALSISLVIPSMRNFLMLIVYGQSVHVGRHFL